MAWRLPSVSLSSWCCWASPSLRTQSRKEQSAMMTSEKRLPYLQQLLYQLLAIFVAFTVLTPILWVVSMSLDPRNIARPAEFNLIPPGASLAAYVKVLNQPTANPVSFTQLAFNQLKLAVGVSF